MVKSTYSNFDLLVIEQMLMECRRVAYSEKRGRAFSEYRSWMARCKTRLYGMWDLVAREAGEVRDYCQWRKEVFGDERCSDRHDIERNFRIPEEIWGE